MWVIIFSDNIYVSGPSVMGVGETGGAQYMHIFNIVMSVVLGKKGLSQ
jgi:hypothetical protein